MYGEALDNHPDDPPSIKLGDIIPVNANSYKSIKIVFKNLQDQSEVGKKRKWVRIGFDSVPYRMASQIIKNTIEYLSCKNKFKNKIIYQSIWAYGKKYLASSVQVLFTYIFRGTSR